jgi:peptidoglycan/xylan/chitin deacetylase (PgdA/CDA1 family)
MIVNKAYYLFKPLIPRSLRLALRRSRARYKQMRCANVWPIDQRAGATPPSWPGWPEGKRFALVLTHDVESGKGLANVEQLMKLELKHGFRSSFNLVPEGDYRIPDETRYMLEHNGFEVGVHGLEHDGKLYASKPEFAAKAARIREYLRSWSACGFRSPLMQHKLGWLHELNAYYDASTFDTDPFEPEPDGARTIFPFWVPGPNGSGYVELPYTLVQDFTLFVILRERNIDVWKGKLDWIAEHGGMAVINTHPDYICFNGNQASDEYPASYYQEFLQYVREKYEGAYWHTLPRDVARFYIESVPPASRNSRKKICMLAYSDYEAGSRVRCHAETLAGRGDQVDVIALNEGNGQMVEEVNGVTVHRIQRRADPDPPKWAHAWRTVRFLLSSSTLLTRLQSRTRYDLIHVYGKPDVLVFAAWYPKLAGTPILLDTQDVVPLLKPFGKASTWFADHVMVSGRIRREQLTSNALDRNSVCDSLIAGDLKHIEGNSSEPIHYSALVDSLSTEVFTDQRPTAIVEKPKSREQLPSTVSVDSHK